MRMCIGAVGGDEALECLMMRCLESRGAPREALSYTGNNIVGSCRDREFYASSFSTLRKRLFWVVGEYCIFSWSPADLADGAG